MNVHDIWTAHFSVKSWMSSETWDNYLCEIEQILGDRIEKLDSNDPLRRKADTKAGEGAFVVDFGEREDSDWIFGKFDKTKIEFQIRHFKTGSDSFGRLCHNSIEFYIPHKMNSVVDAKKIARLFAFTNQQLESFYAYADFKDIICAKKPFGPSLDISCELLGIFWLTYFGGHYCDFFKRPRLLSFSEAGEGPTDGITFQLAESASEVGLERRPTIEAELGELSFAGYGKFKTPGQHVLTLVDLKKAPINKRHST